MSSAVQEQTLQDITQKALGVWNGAVEQAEQHRNKIQGTIDEAASEARMIAAQLGDFTDMDDEERRARTGFHEDPETTALLAQI